MGSVHNRGPPAKPIKGKAQFLSQNKKNNLKKGKESESWDTQMVICGETTK